MAKEFFRLVRRKTKHADAALRWTNQTSDQIHQSRFAGTIRADQAGDTRRQRKIHAVNSQHFTIKLRDIFKNNVACFWLGS